MNNYKLYVKQILDYVYLIKQAIKRINCTHRQTFVYIENVAATCETTTITCMNCGKKTTKTEC
jgi:hypothetical protein